MLNSSGESGHPCLFPDIRGNVFKFSPLRIIFSGALSCMGFIMLRYVPFSPAFWMVFIINGCWLLSKAFPVSIEIIIWFLSFNLLMWGITLVDLWILKNSCTPGIKPLGHDVWFFLICRWILFYYGFVKDFCIYVHQWYSPVVFFFCGIFVWFWY